MMISTKGRYALRVMIEMAERKDEELISLKSIAENQNMSEKYLESIVAILVKHNLAEGHRGKGGGYRLTKPIEEYTAGEILRITEGTLAPVACLKDNEENCERSCDCKTLPIWQNLNKIVNSYLDSVKIVDLVE